MATDTVNATALPESSITASGRKLKARANSTIRGLTNPRTAGASARTASKAVSRGSLLNRANGHETASSSSATTSPRSRLSVKAV